MFSKYIINFYELCIFILFFSTRNIKCNEDDPDIGPKVAEATDIAQTTALTFMALFEGCLQTTMNNDMFSVDNLHQFIVSPSRTTVGFMPKFTANRKFFANLISTTRFKEMLNKDELELRKNYIAKMKYCDGAIMDESVLKDFYDREVDQSKI